MYAYTQVYIEPDNSLALQQVYANSGISYETGEPIEREPKLKKKRIKLLLKDRNRREHSKLVKRNRERRINLRKAAEAGL
jgi:hypothetical protein